MLEIRSKSSNIIGEEQSIAQVSVGKKPQSHMKISHGYFEGKKTFSCLGLFKKVFKSRTTEHFSFTIPDDAIDGRKLAI